MRLLTLSVVTLGFIPRALAAHILHAMGPGVLVGKGRVVMNEGMTGFGLANRDVMCGERREGESSCDSAGASSKQYPSKGSHGGGFGMLLVAGGEKICRN